MVAKIQHRRDNAANWTSVNPVLSLGEPGYEIDTGRMKVGDGTTAWATLPYSSLPATELAGLYAQQALSRPGNRAVFLGDSLTLGSDAVAINAGHKTSIPYFASLQSNGRIFYTVNAGIAGNTSAQMLARFDTDVTPSNPTLVFILAGTNDTGTSVTLATFAANMTALVAKCRNIGAKPVLATMPPNSTGSPANRKADIIAFNRWLHGYALANGITLVDFYTLLTDPANGNYKSAYNSDGTHPNSAGLLAMSSLVNTKVAPLLPDWCVPLCADANDPKNLAGSNKLFLAGTVFPTGWGQPVLSGLTLSLDSSDPNIVGNAFQMATVATASQVQSSLALTDAPSIVAGHRYAISGYIRCSGMNSTTKVSVRVRWKDGSNATLMDMYGVNSIGDNVAGAFYAEYPCPAGTVTSSLDYIVTAGTGTVALGQFGYYDLTAMGVQSLLS